MKKYTYWLIAASLFIFSSCLKSEDSVVIPDPLVQLAKDTVNIRKFLTLKSIPATKYDVTGVYYQIITPGTGDTIPKGSSIIKYKYKVRLLDGNVILESDIKGEEVTLEKLILGLQLGIPLIRKGGEIRLIMASGYAYEGYGTQDGVVPPNAILDYDIELLDVK